MDSLLSSHSAFNELYGSSSSTAQFGSMAAAEGTPGTPLPPIMAPRLGGEDGDGEIGKGTWAIPARPIPFLLFYFSTFSTFLIFYFH